MGAGYSTLSELPYQAFLDLEEMMRREQLILPTLERSFKASGLPLGSLESLRKSSTQILESCNEFRLGLNKSQMSGGLKRKMGEEDVSECEEAVGTGRTKERKRQRVMGDNSEDNSFLSASARSLLASIETIKKELITVNVALSSSRKVNMPSSGLKAAARPKDKLPKASESAIPTPSKVLGENHIEIIPPTTVESSRKADKLSVPAATSASDSSSKTTEKSSSDVPATGARISKAIETNVVLTRDVGTQTEAPSPEDTSSSELQEIKSMITAMSSGQQDMKNMVTTMLSKFEQNSEVTQANSAALILLADETRRGEAKIENMNAVVLGIKKEMVDRECVVKMEDVSM